MGRIITTDGLVLRVYPRGESDSLIYLLTPERGRLAVIVRHGRSGHDKLASVAQLFTWGNFELSDSHGILWLRGGSVHSSFYGLSRDLSDMALGAYLCDLAGEVVYAADPPPPGEGPTDEMATFGERILRMLLNSLYALEREMRPPALIKGVFELRTAALAGFCPDLRACALCGDSYPVESYLDVSNGRLICDRCKRRLDWEGNIPRQDEKLGERSVIIPLDVSALAAMRCALAAPDRRIFSFELGVGETERFALATETFLLHHLEREPDTLHYYHTVAEPVLRTADRDKGGTS